MYFHTLVLPSFSIHFHHLKKRGHYVAGTNKTGIYVTQSNLKTRIIPCAKTPLPEVNFISCVHCMQTSEVKILKASSAV